LLMLTSSGCVRNRVIAINSKSDWVKLGPGVTGRVYTTTNGVDWILSPNKVQLPEGWTAGPGDR
jgi:hypothetical protein